MPLTETELDNLERTFHLSAREVEILVLILDGVSTNGELAARMGLTVGTVKMYVHQLLSKLGVPDKLAGIIMCLEAVGRL
jgi:DNA-binding CsgD family transcriptional regulator